MAKGVMAKGCMAKDLVILYSTVASRLSCPDKNDMVREPD